MSDRLLVHENAKTRLDRALLRIDLNNESASLKQENTWNEDQSNQITLVHEDALRVALFVFRAGAFFRDHRVSGPITVQALSGRLAFSTEDGEECVLEKGQIVSLAGGITHSVEALEDSEMLLTVVQTGEPAKQNATA